MIFGMNTTLRVPLRLLALGLGAVVAMAAVTARADLVVIVAEPELRPAMSDWITLRGRQGHRVKLATPSDFPDRLGDLSSQAKAGERAVLVLVGDGQRSGVPPVAAPTTVIRRYGPEDEIASDAPLGQLVGADVVARLPFNEPEALHAYLDRVVKRETSPATWGDLRLQLAAGVGGFSPMIDAAIEQAAAGLFNRLAPLEASMSLTRYAMEQVREAEPIKGQPDEATPTRGGIWVWMGHGHRHELAGVADESLDKACGGADVAVLLACYAGDFAAPGRCVAERLLTASEGPLAVVAATRVTMPYGNTRLGAELLMGLREESRPALGVLFSEAKSHSLDASNPAELQGLDQLAGLLGADIEMLGAERQEHATAYHLLGDPLLTLCRTTALPVTATDRIANDTPIEVHGVSPFAGRLRVEIAKSASRGGGDLPLVVERDINAGEAFHIAQAAPEGWRSGSRRLRIGVEGPTGLAVGVATVTRGAVKVAATDSSAGQ